MKQRIITGAILVLVMICVFALSGTFVYPALITALCAIGVWEMLGCVGLRKVYALSVPSLVFSLITPLSSFKYSFTSWVPIIVFALFYMLFVSVFTQNKITTEKASLCFATVFYVIICFSSLLRLRYIGTQSIEIGKYIYLLVFIGAWITDTFAYFTGVFFGKHKLIPQISPKKTIEGSIGGSAFCIVAFLIYGAIIAKVSNLMPNFLGLALVGLVMSVISQIGDLLASAIKRNYKIKDYGNLFPGHGGVLDRFDSIMVLSPFLLLLCENAKFVNILFLY